MGNVTETSKSATARQHQQGKLTAQERLEMLCDEGSFQAFGEGREASPGDAILAGCGTINGRRICVYAQDMTDAGGALRLAGVKTISALQEHALSQRAPLIGLIDSSGTRLQDGLAALAGLGEILQRAAHRYGISLQIAVVMGPCIGAQALLAGLSDFVFMVRDQASLCVTGPEVVAALTQERVRAAELGGADVHTKTSGIAAASYDNDVEALLQIRRFIGFLPGSHEAEISRSFDAPERPALSLDSLVPDDPAEVYDVKELILKILDAGDFFEIGAAYAPNLIVGLGRIEGHVIGVITNQPLVLAGVLDCDGVQKATRFIRFCGNFQIPIVTLVDVPGFLPGIAEEHAGLARHAAELLRAYAQAPVPKISIVLRNGLGAAYLAMGAKSLSADRGFAWPSAKIALIGGQGEAMPQEALAQGLIDAIIAPHETRTYIIAALKELRPARLKIVD
jgi:propionyl-CoA carboxylase beta chain